jgi:uncharacterized protein
MKKILIVFGLFLGMLPYVMAQTNSLLDYINKPVVEVEGTSEIKVLPDEALILVTISIKGNQIPTITSQLNKKVRNLEEELKKTKLKNYQLTIDNYSIFPNTVHKKEGWVEEGYVANQTLKIRVNDTGEDLIKIIEKVQQTQEINFNLSFRLSDQLQKRMEDTLIELAIKDAKRKAQLIALGFGFENIQVLKVTYSSGGGFQPVYQNKQMRVAMEFDMASSPMVIPEEMTLTDRILVSFFIGK